MASQGLHGVIRVRRSYPVQKAILILSLNFKMNPLIIIEKKQSMDGSDRLYDEVRRGVGRGSG